MKLMRVLLAAIAMAGATGCGAKKKEITSLERKEAANLVSEAQFALTLKEAEPVRRREDGLPQRACCVRGRRRHDEDGSPARARAGDGIAAARAGGRRACAARQIACSLSADSAGEGIQ